MSERRIFVIGSLNTDLLQAVSRLPRPGETITGAELQIGFGGKGANQARAAHRLGATVVMVGKVGDDEFGHAIRTALANDGLDVSYVLPSRKATGTAIVLLLPDGENSIVIAPGANGDLQPGDLDKPLSEMKPGDLLLCQLETPLETVAAALRVARQRGATTMLDPAPARELPVDLLRNVDILTPNETEAAELGASDDIHQLAELTGGTIVIKKGSEGCIALRNGHLLTVPAFQVDAVDTTGAGDTFNAALSVALLRDKSFEDGLLFANAAAALSVTRKGAGSSSPTGSEVETFLQAYNL